MNRCSRLFVVGLTVVIASSFTRHEARSQGREPVSPDEEEVAAHLVGTVHFIRMDFARFPELEVVGTVPVEVLVDEHGNVSSVKLGGEDLTRRKSSRLVS